jgi:hypothetical protein
MAFVYVVADFIIGIVSNARSISLTLTLVFTLTKLTFLLLIFNLRIVYRHYV